MTNPNMHRKDFRPCAICHKGVMHTGLPLFWRLRIERMGVDMQAAQRQHGMEQFFGGSAPGAVALADVFNDGAPITKPLDEAKTVLVCESCACAMETPCVAALSERGV